jgi:hypothetical protein
VLLISGAIHDALNIKREVLFMKKQLVCLIVGVMLLLGAQPVFSQTSEDFKALKKEIEGLRNDIQDLKKQVQAKPAAAPAPAEFKEAIINIKGAPIKGDKNAKLVLIEFSEYQ